MHFKHNIFFIFFIFESVEFSTLFFMSSLISCCIVCDSWSHMPWISAPGSMDLTEKYGFGFWIDVHPPGRGTGQCSYPASQGMARILQTLPVHTSLWLFFWLFFLLLHLREAFKKVEGWRLKPFNWLSAFYMTSGFDMIFMWQCWLLFGGYQS